MRIKEKTFIFIFLIIILLASNILILRVFALGTDSSKNIPRVVLVELFIQATCPDCPHVEFCLEELVWEYGLEKLILLEEHLWGDGYDIPETNARYNWYIGESKKGTPDLFINGLTHRIQGLACEDFDENYEYYKELIDSELVRPSSLEVSASKNVSGSTIIIEGKIKNINRIHLENIAICGMIYKEGEKTGLYYWVREIFPFKDISLLLPEDSLYFKFTSKLLLQQKEYDKDKFHAVIFVQDIETKKVLQALHID